MKRTSGDVDHANSLNQSKHASTTLGRISRIFYYFIPRVFMKEAYKKDGISSFASCGFNVEKYRKTHMQGIGKFT